MIRQELINKITTEIENLTDATDIIGRVMSYKGTIYSDTRLVDFSDTIEEPFCFVVNGEQIELHIGSSDIINLKYIDLEYSDCTDTEDVIYRWENFNAITKITTISRQVEIKADKYLLLNILQHKLEKLLDVNIGTLTCETLKLFMDGKITEKDLFISCEV